jgi:sec-independent protein translocase protein TatB
MPNIGFMELLVVGTVALIVIGPKDLPGMFRTLGRFTAKARGMAREFSRAMNDAADDAGIKEATNTIKAATNPKATGLDALNRAADKFEKWDPSKPKPPPQTAAEAIDAGETAQKAREEAVKSANANQEAQAKTFAAAKEADAPADAGDKGTPT